MNNIASIINEKDAEIVYSAAIGKNIPITVSSDLLKSGETLNITEVNRVMNNKHLSATFSVVSLENASVDIGHGPNNAYGGFVRIDAENVGIWGYGWDGVAVMRSSAPHNFKSIGGYIRVAVDVNNLDQITVQVFTPGNEIFCMKDARWGGGRFGNVFMTANGTDVTDIKASWSCDDYKKPIWMIGDSYFSVSDPSRWPYYLVRYGYTNHLMIAQGGMNTETGLVEFKTALQYGTPKYAFWCVGMNNGDPSATEVQSAWMDATNEFLAICKEKGITPILATIPTTPVVYNYAKSAWIKASGYRYVDFSAAVGGYTYDEAAVGRAYENPKGGDPIVNTTGNEWYPDMLYGDQVHPAKEGAVALYYQVLVDFPEIMLKI